MVGQFFGDTPYTVAQNLLIENIGRLQSGGAIGAEEVQNFKNLLPRPSDTSDIQKQKLQQARDFLNEKLRVYGQTPPSQQPAQQTQESTPQASNPQLNTIKTMIQFDLNGGHSAQDIVNAMLKSQYAADVQADLAKGYSPEELIQLYTQ